MTPEIDIDKFTNSCTLHNCTYIVGKAHSGMSFRAVHAAIHTAKQELCTIFVTDELTRDNIYTRISKLGYDPLCLPELHIIQSYNSNHTVATLLRYIDDNELEPHHIVLDVSHTGNPLLLMKDNVECHYTIVQRHI